jgi:hypothetical protein
MKRALLILLAIGALTAPILVIGQSKATRDSLNTKKSERAGILQDEAKKQEERARLAAEKDLIKAEKNKTRAARRAHARAPHAGAPYGGAPGDWDNWDADVEPAIAGAWEGAEAAMEAAAAAMENIDWGAINESMHHAAAALADMPPMPDMPPFPDIPPIAAIPPIPAIPAMPPMPDFAIVGGRGFGPGRSWGFSRREYSKELSEDDQVRLQALAALLNNDEKTALPEIKTLARQNENWAMRAYAVSMLANAESADVVPILEEVLNKDTDQRVRKAAVRALSQRDEPAAREALKRLLMK